MGQSSGVQVHVPPPPGKKEAQGKPRVHQWQFASAGHDISAHQCPASKGQAKVAWSRNQSLQQQQPIDGSLSITGREQIFKIEQDLSPFPPGAGRQGTGDGVVRGQNAGGPIQGVGDG